MRHFLWIMAALALCAAGLLAVKNPAILPGSFTRTLGSAMVVPPRNELRPVDLSSGLALPNGELVALSKGDTASEAVRQDGSRSLLVVTDADGNDAWRIAFDSDGKTITQAQRLWTDGHVSRQIEVSGDELTTTLFYPRSEQAYSVLTVNREFGGPEVHFYRPDGTDALRQQFSSKGNRTQETLFDEQGSPVQTIYENHGDDEIDGDEEIQGAAGSRMLLMYSFPGQDDQDFYQTWSIDSSQMVLVLEYGDDPDNHHHFEITFSRDGKRMLSIKTVDEDGNSTTDTLTDDGQFVSHRVLQDANGKVIREERFTTEKPPAPEIPARCLRLPPLPSAPPPFPHVQVP